MISPSVDNIVQEETTKATQGDNIRHMGKRRKKLKGNKKTLTSMQKENVNPMGSLVFCTQHKGIYYCNNMSDSLTTILGYLETHLSIIHPSSSKMTMTTIANMYLTTTLFLRGVHIVLFLFKVIFIFFGVNIDACFL
jgi:hypothetical protein